MKQKLVCPCMNPPCTPRLACIQNLKQTLEPQNMHIATVPRISDPSARAQHQQVAIAMKQQACDVVSIQFLFVGNVLRLLSFFTAMGRKSPGLELLEFLAWSKILHQKQVYGSTSRFSATLFCIFCLCNTCKQKQARNQASHDPCTSANAN